MTDNRFRIDWGNLSPFPRKRRDDGASREDLAARRFNMGKAQHKGRCHVSNQKRRQAALEAAAQAKINKAKRDATFRKYKDAVRAFWNGETDEHP